MLGRVQVEHELAERAFEPGKLALQDREPAARHAGGPLEIHEAHRLADLEMLPCPVRPWLHRAEGAHHDIVVLVLAGRHVVERDVGQDGERASSSLSSSRSIVFGAGQKRLDLADLGLQRFGKRGVAGAHGVADFLGGGVAAFLLGLQRAEMGAPRLVERDQFGDRCVRQPHRSSCASSAPRRAPWGCRESI